MPVQDDNASSMAAASRRSLQFRDYQMQRQNSVSPATGCVAAFPFPMVKQKKLENLPSTSPLEKLYRYMWRRKVGPSFVSRHKLLSPSELPGHPSLKTSWVAQH